MISESETRGGPCPAENASGSVGRQGRSRRPTASTAGAAGPLVTGTFTFYA